MAVRKGWATALVVGLLLGGWFSTTPEAQPFAAQIVRALRAYGLTSPGVFSGSSVTVAQGSLAANANAISTSATWNNAGVTFTHWRAVITDTASGASSMALQIFGGAAGSTSLFSVSKGGAVVAGGRITSASDFLLTANGAFQIQNPADGQAVLRDAGGSNGVGLDVATDGILKVRTRAQSADAAITGSTITGSTDVKVGVNSVTTGVATGYRIARGATAFDASNPTTVATGLTTVVSCTGTLRLATALTTGTAFVTHAAPSGANVDWYAWVLAGTASTGTETFDWVCVGT